MTIARRTSLHTRHPRILEVGCGTGKWLADLSASTLYAKASRVFGLDLSMGMLRQAHRREPPLRLTRGRAEQLPFPAATFDLVYCVNAIHHFDRPRAFISEACRLLRPGGRLAVIGMDPHGRRESWYVYRYFEGVYETDLRRFPSWADVAGWMATRAWPSSAGSSITSMRPRPGGPCWTIPFSGRSPARSSRC